MLLWWAMERLVAADDEGSARTALASGLLWGAAVLTRETVLYFLPVAALWLAWRRKGGARRAAWLLAAAALVVVPWTVRNWLVFDAFVPVSTSGALNLWQGNTRLSRQQVYEEYWAVHGRIPKYELARRRAVEAILERQPLWILEKLRDEMPAFWAAHGQPVVHLERGAYGAVARPRALAAVVLVLGPYLLALASSSRASRGCRAAARRSSSSPSWPSTSCSTWPRTGTRATACRRCPRSSWSPRTAGSPCAPGPGPPSRGGSASPRS